MLPKLSIRRRRTGEEQRKNKGRGARITVEIETYRRSAEARRSGRYTAVSELLSGGEALGVAEVLRALVLCVAAECSARRREAMGSGEDGECEEGERFTPPPLFIREGRAAVWDRSCHDLRGAWEKLPHDGPHDPLRW